MKEQVWGSKKKVEGDVRREQRGTYKESTYWAALISPLQTNSPTALWCLDLTQLIVQAEKRAGFSCCKVFLRRKKKAEITKIKACLYVQSWAENIY